VLPPLPPLRCHRHLCRDAAKLTLLSHWRQVDTTTAPPGKIREQLFPMSSLSLPLHDKCDVCFVLWDFLIPTHKYVGFLGRSAPLTVHPTSHRKIPSLK
jgi:hypothetical protein